LFTKLLPSTAPPNPGSPTSDFKFIGKYRKFQAMHLVLYLIGEKLTTKHSSILYVNVNDGMVTLDVPDRADDIREISQTITDLWAMVPPREINDRDSALYLVLKMMHQEAIKYLNRHYCYHLAPMNHTVLSHLVDPKAHHLLQVNNKFKELITSVVSRLSLAQSPDSLFQAAF
jgi:hypothetical protein